MPRSVAVLCSILRAQPLYKPTDLMAWVAGKTSVRAVPLPNSKSSRTMSRALQDLQADFNERAAILEYENG